MRIVSKKISAFALTLGLASLLAVPALVGAQAEYNDPKNIDYGLATNFNKVQIGRSNDLRATIATLINIILGFLGIIAVIIILVGGFKWMTAGGNDDQVGDAKKMIIQGIIGIFIIFAAWAIAAFVITQLRGATNA